MDHGAARARAMVDSLGLAQERFDEAGHALVRFADACDEEALFTLGQITSGLIVPAMQSRAYNREVQSRALFIVSVLARRHRRG
jgi:hypothetical protein